jgi:hypothetical protein
MHRWLGLAVAFEVLAVGGSAHAFCRTTSSKPPPGYDPATSGCWTDGVPLAWPAGRIPYAVAAEASTQVSLSEATRIADLAFGAWNSALCTGGSPSIQAYDEMAVSVPAGLAGDALAGWSSCTDIGSCQPAAHDVIVFDDAAWPYNDPVNTLALTTVTFGVDDGRIAEAYTEVNSVEHMLSTEEPPPANGSAYDLQAILTHEAGHFLGMAHATDTNAVMYAYYQPGAIQLTPDDVAAICSVYPPSPPPKAGCGCDTPGGPFGLAGSCAGLSLVAAVIGRRRARRASSVCGAAL